MVLRPQQQNELRPVPKWLEQLDCPEVPYLKNVSMNMLKPQQFGLEQWQRYFVIPDKWMRKIYQDEVYHDTDLPRKEQPESLTNEQKRLIYDWLKNDSPFRHQATKVSFKPRSNRSNRTYEPSTDLVDVLEAARDSDLDSEDLVSDDKDESDIYDPKKIPILIGHKYQPEHMIVRKAIQNMRQLPEEEKDRVNRFMSDSRYMKLMHEMVSAHLGKSSDGYAI